MIDKLIYLPDYIIEEINMKRLMLIYLFLIALSPLYAREKIRIPDTVDDTLRMTWKNVDPSYYLLYKRNYAGKDQLLKLIGYKNTSIHYKIDVPSYNYRAAFYVSAIFIDKDGTREIIISDTLATFFGREKHTFCDVNHDWRVDDLDLNAIFDSPGYGVPEGNPDYDPVCDVNGDGDINLIDAGFVLSKINKREQKEFYSTKNKITDYEPMYYDDIKD